MYKLCNHCKYYNPKAQDYHNCSVSNCPAYNRKMSTTDLAYSKSVLKRVVNLLDCILLDISEVMLTYTQDKVDVDFQSLVSVKSRIMHANDELQETLIFRGKRQA